MIAFSWRQFRTQALIGGARAWSSLGIVLLVTGPHLVHVYDTRWRRAGPTAATARAASTRSPHRRRSCRSWPGALVLVVPVLIGMFWGAPLVARELETGTFRLAWTQSVSRLRWLLVKLGLVGLASAAVGGLLSLMVSWWFSPIDKVNANRFSPAAFGMHGFVPAGYALFAFALGATTGLLFRRTLPAMAVTLVGFVAARVAVAEWIRPHFMSPVTKRSHQPERRVGHHPVLPAEPSVQRQSTEPPQCAGRLEQHRQQCRAVTVGRVPAEGVPQPARPQRARRPVAVESQAHAAVSASGQQAFQQCIDHRFGQVPPGGHLSTGQPVLGLPDLRDAAVRRRSAALAGLCVWWVRRRLS